MGTLGQVTSDIMVTLCCQRRCGFITASCHSVTKVDAEFHFNFLKQFYERIRRGGKDKGSQISFFYEVSYGDVSDVFIFFLL